MVASDRGAGILAGERAETGEGRGRIVLVEATHGGGGPSGYVTGLERGRAGERPLRRERATDALVRRSEEEPLGRAAALRALLELCELPVRGEAGETRRAREPRHEGGPAGSDLGVQYVLRAEGSG
jgi:hypothetical protein